MNSMFFRVLLGAFCFMMLLESCDSESVSVVGEDWIVNDTKVFYIDTFTVHTSTYKFDSIAINSPSRYLLGSYTDPVFGTVKASPYLELYSDAYYIDDEAVFDSVALLLNYTDYYYNDTIPTQQYNVYEVLETLTPEEDYFYNTTTYETDPVSIGELRMSPTPIREDSIQFTLDPAFGKRLFTAIQESEINNITELTDTYKGLYIDSGDDNTTVLGIGTGSKLRLYYSIENEDDTEEDYYDFTINSLNSFHNISADQSNTYFENLTEQTDEVKSTDSDNLNFIQAGTGLVTKIDIPYISQINTLNGSGSIMNANLKLSLKKNSYDDDLSVRDSLPVYIIDNSLDIASTLTSYEGNVVYAYKSTEEFDTNYTTYNISVHYFLDLKMNAINGENLYLGVTSQGYNDSVDRYIFEGENSEDSNIKTYLELNYALYNEE